MKSCVENSSEIYLVSGTGDIKKQNKLRLGKSAYPDWVLWNIGDKASSLADLGEGEEKNYVCVEPAKSR